MSKTNPELAALKAELRAEWMAGEFAPIARAYAAGVAEFVERLRLPAGIRVLDVGCGTGNASIPAARAGAQVTGVDVAPNLLSQAEAWAHAEGLVIQLEQADAEDLPFVDASFDAVISAFATAFMPQPAVVAAEMLRVCRPGGLIALINWTPESFSSEVGATIRRHIAPGAEPGPASRWGTEEGAAGFLAGGVRDLRFNRRRLTFVYALDPSEVVEIYRRHYGPTRVTFDGLSRADEAALRHDLEQLWREHNQARDGTTRVESEYLEAAGRRCDRELINAVPASIP